MGGTDEFFVSVLPAGGTFVLAWKNKTSGWKHKTFNDIDAACKTSDELANSGFDVYFCIGTILDPKFKNDKGKVSPRAQENIFKIKSLVLDLDVDESSPKKFHSQEEALVSLANFQETFQLPTPTVVSSGYGIHVYFPLEEALNPAEWLKLANLFKSVVGHFDKRLIADPTRVCDYAGLLRVPNTFNFKKEIPAETSVLSLAEETLSESRILDSFKEYIVQNELSEAKDVKPFARPKVKLSL